MAFRDELRQKRKELGLTQPEMAKKCGLSVSTYKNLEIYDGGYTGSMPSVATIKKLKKKGIIPYSQYEVINMLEIDRKYGRRKKKLNEKHKNKNLN